MPRQELLQTSFLCRGQFLNQAHWRIEPVVDPRHAMENRLTRYELELMNVLWELGEGTVQDVCDKLDRPLAYTTVMTTLSLLESKKRVLERRKCGRAFVYRPLMSREAISRSMIADLREVLFGNRLPSLVLNLLSEEEMNEGDVAALRAALDQIEAKS
jgi:predicted transcriptional regulator